MYSGGTIYFFTWVAKHSCGKKKTWLDTIIRTVYTTTYLMQIDK